MKIFFVDTKFTVSYDGAPIPVNSKPFISESEARKWAAENLPYFRDTDLWSVDITEIREMIAEAYQYGCIDGEHGGSPYSCADSIIDKYNK